MAIGAVELNHAMTGINDYNHLRHQEDTKGMVDQTNFKNKFNQAVETRINNVHAGDDVNNNQKKFDAKEKGGGTYSGDGGKNRNGKKQQDNADGKVIPKYSGFDMKI